MQHDAGASGLHSHAAYGNEVFLLGKRIIPASQMDRFRESKLVHSREANLIIAATQMDRFRESNFIILANLSLIVLARQIDHSCQSNGSFSLGKLIVPASQTDRCHN